MALVLDGSANTIAGLAAGGISNSKAIAAAAMPAGSIIQVQKSADYTTQTDYTSGQESAGPTVDITLTYNTSLVYVTGFLSHGETAGDLHIYMYRDSTKIGIGSAVGSATRSMGAGSTGRQQYDVQTTHFTYVDNPYGGSGTPAAITYKLTGQSTNGTFSINKHDASNENSANDNSCISYIVAMEVKQ